MNSRRTAAFAVCRWRATHEFTNELLPAACADRAFVQDLVYTVVRRYRPLRSILGELMKTWPKGELEALVLVGAAQILYMPDVPDFAAVNETVAAAKASGREKRLDRVVNGVLRNLIRRRDEFEAKLAVAPLAERESYPNALIARWVARYGEANAEALAKWHNQPAETWLAFKDIKVFNDFKVLNDLNAPTPPRVLNDPNAPKIPKAPKVFNDLNDLKNLPPPDTLPRFPKGHPRAGTAALAGLDADMCVSFSGLKTALLYHVRRQPPANDAEKAGLVAAYQEAIVGTLADRTATALKRRRYKALIVGGGVSLNGRLRARLAEVATAAGVPLLLAAPKYCGDNAAMIAGLAYWRRNVSGDVALSIDVEPTLQPGDA